MGTQGALPQAQQLSQHPGCLALLPVHLALQPPSLDLPSLRSWGTGGVHPACPRVPPQVIPRLSSSLFTEPALYPPLKSLLPYSSLSQVWSTQPLPRGGLAWAPLEQQPTCLNRGWRGEGRTGTQTGSEWPPNPAPPQHSQKWCRQAHGSNSSNVEATLGAEDGFWERASTPSGWG